MNLSYIVSWTDKGDFLSTSIRSWKTSTTTRLICWSTKIWKILRTLTVDIWRQLRKTVQIKERAKHKRVRIPARVLKALVTKLPCQAVLSSMYTVQCKYERTSIQQMIPQYVRHLVECARKKHWHSHRNSCYSFDLSSYDLSSTVHPVIAAQMSSLPPPWFTGKIWNI